MLRSEHHFSCCELFSMSLSLLFRTNSRDTLPTHSIVNNRVDARRALRCFEGKGLVLFFLWCFSSCIFYPNDFLMEMISFSRTTRTTRNQQAQLCPPRTPKPARTTVVSCDGGGEPPLRRARMQWRRQQRRRPPRRSGVARRRGSQWRRRSRIHNTATAVLITLR